MFSKLSAFFHQAAEFSSQILTTEDSSAQDEFKSHWKEVTDAITDRGSVAMITGHLDAMLDLLCSEEEKMNPSDPGTVGPCLELVLRNKVLDTLYMTARNDYPPGMAHHVLNFFTMLLSRLERPILHHVSIHQPILLQIDSCGDSLSSSLTIHQVQFLRTLCMRLMKDPRLADFFIKDENDKVNFVLLSALLRLANSSDHHVVMKAYESILTCASLRHSSVTRALATSHLPVMLASKLQFHFQLIFPNTKHTDILSCNARWGSSASLCSGHDSTSHVEALYSWLDLCEQIIALSQGAIVKAMCDSIREVFLKASLLPKLLKTKEEEILISTSVLMHALQVVSNEDLLKELVHFILRDSLWVLADESSEVVYRDKMVLIEKLICRIDHINEDVCSTTLQLFDILLRLPFPMIVEELTHSSSAASNFILQPDQMHSARVQLEQDTVSYLSLIPSCLSSGSGGVEDLSQYLREAHDKIAKSHELGGRTSSSSSTINHGDKTFLEMLLNKLESMLNQPYEINLLVTSLFAQLAAVPHPTIESLFQTRTHERNVYTILKKVAEAFQMRVERTPGLVVHIVEARRRLEGLPTSDLLSMPHNDLLEGSVVLEEFIKVVSSYASRNLPPCTSTSVQSLSKMMSLESMEKLQPSVETHDAAAVSGQERVSALLSSTLEASAENFAQSDDVNLSKPLQEPSTVLEIAGDGSTQSQCGVPPFLNFDGLMNSSPSSPTEHGFHSNFNNNSNAGGLEVSTRQSSPFQDVPRKRIRASVPAVCQKSTIEATLEGKALWDEFCRRGTEMIVNRAGRRMFPGFSVAISSLKPKAKYSMKLEVVLADNHRFKFLNSRWLAVGSAEPQPLSESYLHPDSPNSGAFWMRHGVSFRKLKITNNKERPGNNALLYSMHKYFLRLVVEEERKLSPGEDKVQPRVVLCLDFPETTFVAVTAYQNEEVTQLKITNNPFAKAFRENAADMDWETSQLLYSNSQTSFTPLPQRAVDHFSGGYWPFASPTLAPLPPPLSPLSGYATPTMGYSSSATSPPYPLASSSSTPLPFASSTVPHGQSYFQWPAHASSMQSNVLPNPFSVYHKVENSSSVGVNLPDFETVFTNNN